MPRTAAASAAAEVIEQGSVTFFYRPRVEEQHADELADVQRLIILLSPEGSAFERAIAVGRKRLPPSSRRDRFWGFVDLVLTHYDMHAALGAQVYGTKTRGLRHLPAAKPFASGTYDIATHGSHSHLRWRVEQFEAGDPIAAELAIEDDADYIVTVANPDPVAWGLLQPPDLQSQLFDDLELHVTIPPPAPPPARRRAATAASLSSTRRSGSTTPAPSLCSSASATDFGYGSSSNTDDRGNSGRVRRRPNSLKRRHFCADAIRHQSRDRSDHRESK